MRVVVGNQFLGNATILLPGDVAGRQVHEPGMIRVANEFEDIESGIGVGGKSITQIRIEIGQARSC